jgi:undecaprenyl-phosphate 4-deoxy-4-formamido-L-arabinose transferase
MTPYLAGGEDAIASTRACADLPDGVSVVVPVYNSEAMLPLLIARLDEVLRGLAQRHEVILVNDGSRDGSWEVVRRLARTHGCVRGFNLMRNFGQHNALLCGIRAASYAIIVTIDDDLQNPPEEIPKLVDELNRGFDVVYGPPEKQRHGLLRDLASVITKLVLQKTMGAATARKISAFRVFRTRLRQAFANYQSPYVSIDVLLTWGTAKFSSVSVRHDERASGVSNYTLGKLLVHALNMFTGFSTWPLRLASMIGFAFTFFGVGVLCYVFGRYLLQGTTVAGFPFLASIIAIFSGAQLFALGLIGEYLARLHSRMMEKPVYAVLEETPRTE